MLNVGKLRRLDRIFDASSNRTIIVPMDDALLAGPEDGLRNSEKKVQQLVQGNANAIMGFPGLFKRHGTYIKSLGWILNLTASTTRSMHTRKVLISNVEHAVRLGMDGVGVHVNISSQFEHEMLKMLGDIARECETLGILLIGIMYPRTERSGVDYNYTDLLINNPEKYTELVRHSAKVGVEIGADIIKTQFTGSAETFATVVECCGGTPIIIAGGPKVNAKQMLTNAYEAVQGGASGVSFGRNIFNRDESSKFIYALRMIVHENSSVEEAMNAYNIDIND